MKQRLLPSKIKKNKFKNSKTKYIDILHGINNREYINSAKIMSLNGCLNLLSTHI